MSRSAIPHPRALARPGSRLGCEIALGPGAVGGVRYRAGAGGGLTVAVRLEPAAAGGPPRRVLPVPLLHLARHGEAGQAVGDVLPLVVAGRRESRGRGPSRRPDDGSGLAPVVERDRVDRPEAGRAVRLLLQAALIGLG